MGIHQDEGKSSFPKLHLAIICFINHFSILINVPMATTFAMVRLICTHKFSFFLNCILFILIFTFHLLYSSKNVTMILFFFAFLKLIYWKPRREVKMAKCSNKATRCLHAVVFTEKAWSIKDLFFIYLFGKTKIFSRAVPRGQNIPILPAQVAN